MQRARGVGVSKVTRLGGRFGVLVRIPDDSADLDVTRRVHFTVHGDGASGIRTGGEGAVGTRSRRGDVSLNGHAAAVIGLHAVAVVSCDGDITFHCHAAAVIGLHSVAVVSCDRGVSRDRDNVSGSIRIRACGVYRVKTARRGAVAPDRDTAAVEG
ncbi:hypothetical protein SDC9_54764 [bioreactor metagenome]|uniref:Uncharacterized protein n=1 Tax=bioreactor metagenome TaxID=1076179 RepID=A0A644WXA9_9ZZZZ